MKMFALALSLLLFSPAHAREILVFDLSPGTFESPVSYGHGVYSSFNVNQEMERAWVETVVVDRPSYSQSPRNHYRAKIEGLSYEANTQKVVLHSEGQMVECATVRTTRVFRETRVTPTGNCRFTHRYVKVPYDDGYNTGHKLRLQVFLTVPE